MLNQLWPPYYLAQTVRSRETTRGGPWWQHQQRVPARLSETCAQHPCCSPPRSEPNASWHRTAARALPPSLAPLPFPGVWSASLLTALPAFLAPPVFSHTDVSRNQIFACLMPSRNLLLRAPGEKSKVSPRWGPDRAHTGGRRQQRRSPPADSPGALGLRF